MSLFHKPKTVSEVAEALPGQINCVRIALLDTWAELIDLDTKAELSDEDAELAAFMYASVAYWFGEEPPEINKDLGQDRKDRIKRAQKAAPIKSHEFLSQQKEFRQAMVYVLRMKLVLNNSIYGIEWIKSEEGQRVTKLLDKYGGEFPEEVTDKIFDKFVNRIVRYQTIHKARLDAKKE